MAAKLFCKYGDLKGMSFEIGEQAIIGRESVCEVTLSHPLVSGRHARIFQDDEGGGYFLEDLDSLNGTTVDGLPVSEPVLLSSLHLINFGGIFDFFFQESPAEEGSDTANVSDPVAQPSERSIGPAADIESSTNPDRAFFPMPAALGNTSQTEEADNDLDHESCTQADEGVIIVPKALREQAERLDKRPPALPVRFRLIFLNLKSGPLAFDLEEGENLVGRSTKVRCQVPSNEISRRHAALILKKGAIRLRDLGSTNHTFIEGKEINGEVVILPGALLSFGKVKARLDQIEDATDNKRSGL